MFSLNREVAQVIDIRERMICRVTNDLKARGFTKPDTLMGKFVWSNGIVSTKVLPYPPPLDYAVHTYSLSNTTQSSALPVVDTTTILFKFVRISPYPNIIVVYKQETSI